jgi:hypothetical protein
MVIILDSAEDGGADLDRTLLYRYLCGMPMPATPGFPEVLWWRCPPT